MMEQKIQRCVEVFASDLAELVHEAVTESVAEALKGTASAPLPTRAARKSAAKRRPAPRPPKGASKRATRRRPGERSKTGEKRAPHVIEKIEREVLNAVRKEPGLRVETLADKLERQTKDLTLPIKHLIADKKLKTKGQRRGTSYYPA